MDKTKIAVAIFDKLAKLYQDKFMDVSLYYDSFDLFCKNLPPNAEILELACGPGNITKYLLEQRPDFKILATDLAPNMLELAKINNPTAAFQLLDCKDIGGIEKKYDAIMCGFCLPYLSKKQAKKLIADASKIMNDKGLIFISTMEDDYNRSGWKEGSTGDKIYMHYHQADYLTAALEKNGFSILDIRRKEYELTTDLLIIAQKDAISFSDY